MSILINDYNIKGISAIGLFENNAEQKPNVPAIIFNDQEITYKSLNQKANQLARFLQTFNIKENPLIAICLPKSINLIVSVLAILKIQAAYVPIDPNSPDSIIQHILHDTKTPLLITTQAIYQQCQNESICPIFLDESEDIDSCDNTNLYLVNEILDIAYVAYTSGTTGLPKGVMVSHGGLLNAYLGWERVYRLQETDCHLQMANFSFDVFSGDLTRALCSGGSLVLCKKEVLLLPDKLYELMLNAKVNCAEFVPAVLRKLITYLEEIGENMNFMKIVACGSDSWTIGDYKRFKKKCGSQTRLINSYGVTEATIDSAYFESSDIENLNLPDESLVPINKTFPNVELYLLNDKYEEVLPGDEGEILY